MPLRPPLTIAFEPPSRADLRRPWPWLLGLLLIAAAALAATALAGGRAAAPAASPPAPSATLAVTSAPAGAAVLVEGRERGRTPAVLEFPPGDYQVTLRLAGHADVTYGVRLAEGQSTPLAGRLWRDRPEAQRVRLPLPGAQIADAHFLADGRLALALALPPADERQLWLVDHGGGARRAGPPLAQAAVAPAPDGASVAYFARPLPVPGPGAPPPGPAGVTELWLTERDGERGRRRYALAPNTADERFVDLSWSPDGARLLLVSEQRFQGGGSRTRVRLLELDGGDPRELIALPGEIVAGSWAWHPAGGRLALLTRAANRTTLCLLGTDGALFRSLADVPGEGGAPAPFPPLAWLPGDAVAYAAPLDPAPGARASGTRPLGLFADDFSGRPARRLGDEGLLGPTWREDGLVLALTRPKGNREAVGLRAYTASGEGPGQDLGQLALPAGTPAGARWDPARAQALVALHAPGGGAALDLWLVHWDPTLGGILR